ncbi:putative bifunctional diguanylate cyclase/phosphodiesterase [Sphingomonas kyeonggiensis]|uniref:Diguanylate cyclase (GGDEF)-like protein/PAS domain S-box-containing protein n=1 Tax=Sphingomonas kyeonggiensis TaxID=1268553 RepID=A0A7W6JQU5_9SPHN|nr:EAL domain-containing protein [Sphingomonas kyeonggiensis]MBB4097872.1 diguanylate cyclase (GGDEF)-like protein/PAS domain S-box-containing protein [Sphingomonas kyeonggiensis]
MRRNGPDPLAAEHLRLFRNYEAMDLGWFWATDAEGRIAYISEGAARSLGVTGDALIGRDLISLFKNANEEADVERRRTMPFQMARQARFDAIPLLVDIVGEERWWALSGQPTRDSRGSFGGYLGHSVDVTREQRAAHESNRLAMYDPLTGLPNRRRMSTLLDSTIAAFRNQQRPCALMLIDLDRFKAINDSLGHPVGDALLKQVAERLSTIVGNSEQIARMGGDEFQVILPDAHNRVGIFDLANRIIESLSHPYMINGSRCLIGASIGIAVSPFDASTSDELVRNADLALYAAKGAGRGRARFFSADLLQAAEDRRLLEHDLIDALSKGELAVHYQPIVGARSEEVTGFEALLRWNHPKRGRISPAIFIPIAEDANLIPQLGEWTLRQACIDAAKWPGELRVAVNVSPIQFASEALPAIVMSALANSGLAPERLELEITESVFLEDGSETDARFAALKRLGVRLALDDFGTGYSSLGYLKTAPFDKIKIDQSFVRGTTEEGARNQAIIAAIVALANALGMETTAEGIESFDQLETMRKLNVSHIQGFLYSRAVASEELATHFKDGKWVIQPQGPARQRHIRHTTFRKVGVIHDNHYYPAVLKNVSASGALIDGIVDVPEGTQFVVDLGEGQMAVATVRRSMNQQQGIEFEQPLVEDANGVLTTRHRVSPKLITEAGLQHQGHNLVAKTGEGGLSMPAFHTVTEWNGIEV